ncbi:hypothetical protein KIPB_002821 [Kipferlia bialata]|uniref:Uncharacterized protein n=1 Tax=Kipferlia bialata TaxID=797122 RepID=A0A9K3CT13_9EUKA|nr:hypothetical protein KIPB_002821 [Kipferlia bialata]|eukprot:g2821.t1
MDFHFDYDIVMFGAPESSTLLNVEFTDMWGVVDDVVGVDEQVPLVSSVLAPGSIPFGSFTATPFFDTTPSVEPYTTSMDMGFREELIRSMADSMSLASMEMLHLQSGKGCDMLWDGFADHDIHAHIRMPATDRVDVLTDQLQLAIVNGGEMAGVGEYRDRTPNASVVDYQSRLTVVLSDEATYGTAIHDEWNILSLQGTYTQDDRDAFEAMTAPASDSTVEDSDFLNWVFVPTYVNSFVDISVDPVCADEGFTSDDYEWLQADHPVGQTTDGPTTVTFTLDGDSPTNAASELEALQDGQTVIFSGKDSTVVLAVIETKPVLSSAEVVGGETISVYSMTIQQAENDVDLWDLTGPAISGCSSSAPTSWTCPTSYYTDKDCDTGCGALDPACGTHWARVNGCTEEFPYPDAEGGCQATQVEEPMYLSKTCGIVKEPGEMVVTGFFEDPANLSGLDADDEPPVIEDAPLCPYDTANHQQPFILAGTPYCGVAPGGQVLDVVQVDTDGNGDAIYNMHVLLNYPKNLIKASDEDLEVNVALTLQDGRVANAKVLEVVDYHFSEEVPGSAEQTLRIQFHLDTDGDDATGFATPVCSSYVEFAQLDRGFSEITLGLPLLSKDCTFADIGQSQPGRIHVIPRDFEEDSKESIYAESFRMEPSTDDDDIVQFLETQCPNDDDPLRIQKTGLWRDVNNPVADINKYEKLLRVAAGDSLPPTTDPWHETLSVTVADVLVGDAIMVEAIEYTSSTLSCNDGALADSQVYAIPVDYPIVREEFDFHPLASRWWLHTAASATSILAAASDPTGTAPIDPQGYNTVDAGHYWDMGVCACMPDKSTHPASDPSCGINYADGVYAPQAKPVWDGTTLHTPTADGDGRFYYCDVSVDGARSVGEWTLDAMVNDGVMRPYLYAIASDDYYITVDSNPTVRLTPGDDLLGSHWTPQVFEDMEPNYFTDVTVTTLGMGPTYYATARNSDQPSELEAEAFMYTIPHNPDTIPLSPREVRAQGTVNIMEGDTDEIKYNIRAGRELSPSEDWAAGAYLDEIIGLPSNPDTVYNEFSDGGLCSMTETGRFRDSVSLPLTNRWADADETAADAAMSIWFQLAFHFNYVEADLERESSFAQLAHSLSDNVNQNDETLFFTLSSDLFGDSTPGTHEDCPAITSDIVIPAAAPILAFNPYLLQDMDLTRALYQDENNYFFAWDNGVLNAMPFNWFGMNATMCAEDAIATAERFDLTFSDISGVGGELLDEDSNMSQGGPLHKLLLRPGKKYILRSDITITPIYRMDAIEFTYIYRFDIHSKAEVVVYDLPAALANEAQIEVRLDLVDTYQRFRKPAYSVVQYFTDVGANYAILSLGLSILSAVLILDAKMKQKKYDKAVEERTNRMAVRHANLRQRPSPVITVPTATV